MAGKAIKDQGRQGIRPTSLLLERLQDRLRQAVRFPTCSRLGNVIRPELLDEAGG